MSTAVTETLGWTPDELVGTRMSSILHPDDREVQRATREILYEGASVDTPSEGHVVRVLTKGGDYHWLSGRSHVVTDDSGTFIGVVTGMRNVDSLVHARAEALESAESFRLLADNISEVVLRTRAGVVLWVSQSITPVLGWTADAFVGSHVLELIHREDREQFEAVLLAKASDQTPLTEGMSTTRVRVRHANGAHRWAEIRTSHFVDSHGKHDGGISTFHLIDDQISVEQDLQRRATHDHLTGMLNRDELMVRLRMADAVPRTPGNIRAVIFCDIDNFKTINDTDGHQVGDEVLVHLAARIRSALRSSDLVARMGGDEFVIVLEGVRGLDEAEAIAEKLRRVAETPIVTSSRIINASLSIGVTIRAAGEDVDTAIGRADQALYQAKRSGRNRVVAVPAP
jgi:diguanylate cyclase (GGDEF)-like protein/PAS domain S-box-containing protein